jgi:hypothetical protein
VWSLDLPELVLGIVGAGVLQHLSPNSQSGESLLTVVILVANRSWHRARFQRTERCALDNWECSWQMMTRTEHLSWSLFNGRPNLGRGRGQPAGSVRLVHPVNRSLPLLK